MLNDPVSLSPCFAGRRSLSEATGLSKPADGPQDLCFPHALLAQRQLYVPAGDASESPFPPPRGGDGNVSLQIPKRYCSRSFPFLLLAETVGQQVHVVVRWGVSNPRQMWAEPGLACFDLIPSAGLQFPTGCTISYFRHVTAFSQEKADGLGV